MEQLDEKRGYHHGGMNMNRGYHHNYPRMNYYPRRNYYPRTNYYPAVRPVYPTVYYPTYNGYGYNYTNRPRDDKHCPTGERLVKQDDDSYRCESYTN